MQWFLLKRIWNLRLSRNFINLFKMVMSNDIWQLEFTIDTWAYILKCQILFREDIYIYICNSIGTKSHLSKPEIIIHATEKCLSIDKAISKIKWCLLPLGMFLKLFIRYYIGLNVVSRTNKYEIELRLVYLKIVFTNRGKLAVWFFYVIENTDIIHLQSICFTN